MDLKQRKLFTTKEFIFKVDSLHVTVRNLSSFQELEIPYEEINVKKLIRQRRSDNILIFVSCFFGLVFITNVIGMLFGRTKFDLGMISFMMLVATVFTILAYINSKRQILIPTANNGFIDIFDGRPSKQMTEKFISNLILQSNQYLKSKYGIVDRYLPIEPQLANLMFLKEREALTTDEYDELKNELLGKHSTNNSIGFR